MRLTCDLEPDIPNSTTSRTKCKHSLSYINLLCSTNHKVKHLNAATIIECKSREWDGAGRLHWKTINSQIHITVRLHISRLGGLILTLDKPANNSIAARAVLRSAFHDDISLWQTNDVASPNSPYAVSVKDKKHLYCSKTLFYFLHNFAASIFSILFWSPEILFLNVFLYKPTSIYRQNSF